MADEYIRCLRSTTHHGWLAVSDVASHIAIRTAKIMTFLVGISPSPTTIFITIKILFIAIIKPEITNSHDNRPILGF